MLKLVTWNVNSINSRLTRLLAFLERETPDVLCLQELKCVEEKFPWSAIAATGYEATIVGQKAYNGVAILTRQTPTQVRRHFDDDNEDSAARFISARVRADLTIICAYVPNGQAIGSDKYAYKLQWLERLHTYLKRHHQPEEKIALVGDFNVAPSDADVHDPDLWRDQILCSPLERAALTRVADFGLQDVYRHLYPQEKQFSWWDYRMLAFQKNQGLRIDLVLATSSLANKCVRCRIDRDERKGDKASDHAPVIAEFDI